MYRSFLIVAPWPDGTCWIPPPEAPHVGTRKFRESWQDCVDILQLGHRTPRRISSESSTSTTPIQAAGCWSLAQVKTIKTSSPLFLCVKWTNPWVCIAKNPEENMFLLVGYPFYPFFSPSCMALPLFTWPTPHWSLTRLRVLGRSSSSVLEQRLVKTMAPTERPNPRSSAFHLAGRRPRK